MMVSLKIGPDGLHSFNSLSRRILLSIISAAAIFHVFALGQVPAAGPNEVWYVSPAYTYYKIGMFHDAMFPGLIEYENGPFGEGKIGYFLQSLSFHLFGLGLYQARFPILCGGLLATCFVYLVGRYLFGTDAGLLAAVLYLLSPLFFTNTHVTSYHAWVAACFVLAAYFFCRLLREGRSVFAFAAGFAVGMSVNFHLTGVFGVLPMTAALFCYRFIKKVNNAQVMSYLLGGCVAFAVWCMLEIAPIGLGAFLSKSTYGVKVARSGGYIGSRWVNYFFKSGRGILVELPIVLAVIASIKLLRQEIGASFIYLFFLGLFFAYTLFTSSGQPVTAWGFLFVLVGGLTVKFLRTPGFRRSHAPKVWGGLLVLLFLYDANLQAKAAYTAMWIKPGTQYVDLTAKLRSYIPESKTVMGSPLYFLGFAGRNPYITQNFYWERMDAQTHELGISEPQPMPVRTQRMVAFLKRRSVEYLVADPYFQEAIKPWIPADQWNSVFAVLGEVQSPIYGASSGGGQPPYKIQVWGLR